MVVVSFSELRFVQMIRSGEKKQTCRPYSEKQLLRFKNNPTLHLYYRQRRPDRMKIGEAQRNYLGLFRFKEDGVVHLKTKNVIWSCYLDEFAKMDGFENYPEMYAWFAKHYRDLDTREFMVIRWDPDTLIPADATSPAKTTTQEGEA